ncbi:MAG TPA: O-antigen ligase family protein [Thermoanaerobaculia bacterium]
MEISHGKAPARWRDMANLAIVLAGAFAIPLVVNVRDGYDTFRLPKALVFQGEAILLAFVHVGALLLGARLPRPARRDPWFWVPFVAFVAMVGLTLASTKLALSMSALGTAAATLIVFLATVAAARQHTWLLVGVPLAAAVGNAVLVMVEEAHLWMPFGVKPGVPHHLQCSALVGNPNEVGAYLGAAAVGALAWWATDRTNRTDGTNRTHGTKALAVIAVLCAGMLASQSLTAAGAFVAAALVMFVRASPKQALRTMGVLAVGVVLVFLLYAPLRTRVTNMVEWTRSGNYNMLLTDRLAPFAAASLMFADHPVLGIGPGTFAWHYYDYKLRAEERYPLLRLAYNRGVNYGEVHNDHLQVLAEGGLVGYAAFVLALVALAAISMRSGDPSHPTQHFAWRLALPLAVYWLVLSLAQFPLETTVVRSLLVHFAALCVAWRSGA